MTWQRYGDTINSAPEFMKAAEIAAGQMDPRLEAELKGWTLTLFTHCAAEKDDYVVSRAAAVKMIGMGEVERVVDLLKRVGVIVDEATDEDGQRVYRLVKRSSFIHLMTQTDKKMEAKRKKDRNDAKLVVPVLMRDGSTCRYCGDTVSWGDHKHDGGGTFDHREPDQKTTTENFVVCCRGCNRLRADFERPDDELPLLDPPEKPYYDAKLLTKIRQWPERVAGVAHAMGIPNPCKDEVEPHGTSRSAQADAVESAMSAGPDPEPSARPVEVDPQTDRRQPAGGARSANGQGPRSQDSSAAGQGGGGGRKRRRRKRH
ncbi:MAG: hypothetical protein L0K27_02730 [Corynebacterium nuruki]|nr:hypothetical protein [Corynebacterium nuruki]